MLERPRTTTARESGASTAIAVSLILVMEAYKGLFARRLDAQ